MKHLAIILLTSTILLNATKSSALDYPLVTKGRKVSFDEIRKTDLGKAMSIYMLPGHPTSMITTGKLPEGAFTQDEKTNIWTGELHAILKDGLRLRWYYNSEKSSSTEYGASQEGIAYIIIKE